MIDGQFWKIRRKTRFLFLVCNTRLTSKRGRQRHEGGEEAGMRHEGYDPDLNSPAWLSKHEHYFLPT